MKTIKTIIMMAIVMVISLNPLAQNSNTDKESLVSLNPILGQGYLVLDKANNPEVDSWEISLVKRTYSTLGEFNDDIVKIKTLASGVNYFFVPVKFRKMEYPVHYLVNVRGVNSSGVAVVSQSKIHLNANNEINDDLISANGGQPYFETECRKTCIGGDYAYHIQQYKKQVADISRFRLVQASKAYDPASLVANPFYWYTTTPHIDLLQISFVSGGSGNPTVLDQGGNVLTGIVYGYPKGLGPWSGNLAIETDGNHNIGIEYCNESLNLAINRMNNSADNLLPGNPDGYPLLECIPMNSSGGGGYIDPTDPTPPNPNWPGFVSFTFCFENGNVVPCPNAPSVDPSNDPLIGLLNPEVVDLLIISDLNDPSVEPITIDVSSLYNTNSGNGDITNGEFNGFNVSLSPGLYSFGFMFKEKGYWAAIKEVPVATNLSVTQADMVDVAVYPTPIVDDKFDVTVEAYATVKFDYELRDFTGELLENCNFVVHKDHKVTKKINGKNIPQGNLVHRFVFEDGSVKTIQTIKN